VAEDGVFREAALHGTPEGIHIVNALADEGALLEQILIDVGNRPCVGIDARFAGKQPHKPRPPGAWQAHPDARLQDAVAFRDDAAGGIKHGAVERMGHGSDQFPGGIAWQLGIGVQRDDVLDEGENVDAADNFRKASHGPPPQQGVELGEFAAFAFVTHPQTFAGVPAPRAVEQEKQILGGGPIFGV